MAKSSGVNSPRATFWKSDSRFQAIIDSTLDAVVAVDTDGRVVDWNRQAEKLFGWTCDEAVGKQAVDLIVPSRFKSRHQEGLRQFAATGKGLNLDKRLELSALRRSGEEFPVELIVSHINVDNRSLFTLFIRDLSEQQEVKRIIARERLEKSLLQHAGLESSTHNPFNDVLRICLLNLGEITGWPVGHAFVRNKSRTLLESAQIWHSDVDDETLSDFRYISEETTFAFGEGFPGRVWKNGETLWTTDLESDIHSTRLTGASNCGLQTAFGFPVKINDDVVAVVEFFNTKKISPDKSFMLLARGVGDQIGRALERIQWQEQRSQLALIVDSSGDAIIGKSPDGTITSWNKGAELIYGWSADEAIGQTIAIILPLGMAREESEILEAIKIGQRLDQFQTRRMRKDKTVIDVSITVSPICGHDDIILGSSTIERDITLRRRREEEISKARDAAEEANRARVEFLANVSHELRTPMNAILGMLELSLQEDLSSGMRDYLETAKDSADSLLLLVNDILDFSRLGAGRFELEPVTFDLRELLDDAVKTLSLKAHEKGLELACRIHREVPGRVVGDPMRLRQIITNLAGNAIKFTERGEVVVDVKVVNSNETEVASAVRLLDDSQTDSRIDVSEQLQLEFCVSDTGIGIAPKDQERIFAPFTQVDASTTRQHSGTGLGLAICHELIGLMNGRMWLKSEPDIGTRFFFRITLSTSVQNDDAAIDDTVTVDELRDLPVLVVDDNRTNRIILEEMLTNWSMAPTVVESAEEAIHQLTNETHGIKPEPYRLVIVDALMPKTDGFMLLQEAKAKGHLTSATILMLSSADRQVFNDRCEDVDISAYLEKPVSQSDLLDAIMTALKGPQLEHDGLYRIQRTNRTLNILIAEDTPANQKVISAILKKRGHKCVIANNGREAVERLRKDQFDVLLMDVQMPTMDGFQATAVIRELEQESGEHIPIIAMTAHAMRGDRRQCIDAGMDDYVSKPIDSDKLLKLIEYYAFQVVPQHSTGVAEKQMTIPSTELADKQSPQYTEPNVSHSQESVINMQAALGRVGNDRDLLVDMVQFFFEDSPGLLDQIRKHAELSNGEEVARAAHSLKGLSANFGADATVAAAKTIEELGNNGELSNVLETADILERELNRLNVALLEWKSQNS